MITPKQWKKYWLLRQTGWTMKAAAAEAGFSYSAAKAKERGLKNDSGADWRAARMEEARRSSDSPAFAVPLDRLCVEAKRALEDFGYFRYRYFGRKSTPWQEEAGYKVVEFLATKRKEFVVNNEPPGSGKSTLFAHDIPAWLTARNRAIRGLLGHRTQTVAESYLRQLRLTLENPIPIKAEAEDFELGLAVDAEATLIGDFGPFKPSPSILWSNQQIIVAQMDGRPLTHKEATWSAFGLDTTFIGVRVDVALWDDAVEESDLKTKESIDQKRSRWDKVAEKRLEPGGVLILQGQRLGPEDLYRYCLDKQAGESQAHQHRCCEAEAGRKYHHIRFRAHFEDRCDGDHGLDAAYYPAGCLLDPRRLPWEELETEMESDSGAFATVFQQEDANPRELLVNDLWIAGGTDPVTREFFPGCLDSDRDIGMLPEGLAGDKFSVATADPSPTKFWAIQWWIYTPESEFRYLMDLERRSMEAGDFLDWNHAGGRWTGLMESWWQRSRDMGHPIRTWVVEQNAAQRFMLQYEHVRRWVAARDVQIIGHDTYGRNKADPKMGVTSIAPHYRYGRVRLPWRGDGRLATMKLRSEVTKYPQARYDDCVMAQWFLEWNLPNIYSPPLDMPEEPRPSWMRRRAGVGA